MNPEGEVYSCSHMASDPRSLATRERAKLAIPTQEEMAKIRGYLTRVVFLDRCGEVATPDRDRTQLARDLAAHNFVAVDPSKL